MDSLRLAFSPCPNDTYVFYAWVNRLIPGAPEVKARLEDIDTLNRLAMEGEADVIKVSMHAFARLRDSYALVHSGGAMGRGCGPLVVARKDSGLRPAPGVERTAELADLLSRSRVAIPGELTTAALLLGLFTGGVRESVIIPFDRIMPAVVAGKVDAGVIIHEGRFTFGSYGLRRLVDLGEWWEATTGGPLPLGGIAVARTLNKGIQEGVERAVRESLEYARSHPEEAMEYVRHSSQELDDEVCRAHIELYVNEFSPDYGPEGAAAIRLLLRSASEMGVVSDSHRGLFWDDLAS